MRHAICCLPEVLPLTTMKLASSLESRSETFSTVCFTSIKYIAQEVNNQSINSLFQYNSWIIKKLAGYTIIMIYESADYIALRLS